MAKAKFLSPCVAHAMVNFRRKLPVQTRRAAEEQSPAARLIVSGYSIFIAA
ncbi:hypothetical protein [Paenibacillus puerhi]|uniref:hypothetical protein n=1 Tax=Paenibacillus puerhi TaxID=2692622 RepID=UPI001358F6FD|nr:hypothetical protein [Paenibacillus puerhi]